MRLSTIDREFIKMQANQNSKMSKYQFNFQIRDMLLSLGFYQIDENGEKQLRFDPAVYLSRYSAVSCILNMCEWRDEIKKAILFII